ncbi:MAG: mannose-1-phosphate guanylyltransferase/mannose-6-phosphate isomerase [Arcobacteraceae bacterium]
MTNIILCGGSGTRLWPISRTLMPKQFVKLFDDKSLFQLTVERNCKICEKQLVVSNTEQYFLALDQIEELQKTNIQYLLEPIGRNTAPAIALACMALSEDEIVLVTPSDHLIKNQKEYEKCIQQALAFVQENNLVTFGIKPTFAQTGFGYIEAKEYDVKAFHEKPDFQTASEYVQSGNYYWNSGMFMFKAGVFLNELKKYAPQIYNNSLKTFKNASKNEMMRIKLDDMMAIPEVSIDYAVMEKSSIVKVIPSDINWLDVGSFDALFTQLPKDENGNTLDSKYIGINSHNNLIFGSNKTIATVDINDCIIVDTRDALLISQKGSSQKVKQIVEKLTLTQPTLTTVHLTGNRPWGTYTILEESNGYKIKRIEVKAKCRLSLQKHKYRNEHWVVVSGVATVEVEEKIFLLNANESTYIKAGEIHRLSNNTNEPLVIIEVQVGSYTGEDDIQRLEDDFKRENNG